MLLEHTLLTSGEIAESGGVYAGWPAHRLSQDEYLRGRPSSGLGRSGSRYRKLQRVQLQLQEEKKRLDKSVEDHNRELHEANAMLLSAPLASNSGASSTRSSVYKW